MSSVINLQSGFPLNVQQAADARLSLGGTRPRIARTSSPAPTSRPSGTYHDRLASADHPTATWINPAAFALAPAGTFGNTPRTLTDLRIARAIQRRRGGHEEHRLRRPKVAQLKVEILNMLNRPNVRALQGANTVGSANFGQTTIQAGFMRITQVMLRFSF